MRWQNSMPWTLIIRCSCLFFLTSSHSIKERWLLRVSGSFQLLFRGQAFFCCPNIGCPKKTSFAHVIYYFCGENKDNNLGWIHLWIQPFIFFFSKVLPESDKKKSHRQYHSSVRNGLLISNNQYVKNTIYYSSILDSITPPCCVP